MPVKLIAVTHPSSGGVPEELLAHAGEVCYRSEAHGEPGRFLQNIILRGHESIIEHASATFEIWGVSRACIYQLVRHRLASYSQESQRYVDMSDPEFVVPTSIQDNEEAMKIWKWCMDDITYTYRQLRELGIKREDARYVLPNATTTRIVTTMNFRSLRNFFKLRCDAHAQWEIRDVATEMLRIMYQIAPSVFQDLYEGV